MAELLAIAAALFFAVGTVMQQTVAMQATAEEAMRAGFMLQLAKRPVWLAGLVVDALGFVCQAAALGIGTLAVVQPLIATTVVFILPLGARFSGQHVGPRQVGGALAVMGGLIGFLIFGAPSGGTESAPLGRWLIAGGAIAVLTVAFVGGAWGRSPRVKATLLGLGTGLLFAASAALTKQVVDQLGGGVLGLFTHWELYALIVVGWTSMTLNEASLQTGELAPAVATSMSLDPVVSLLLGVFLFSEQLVNTPLALGTSVVALGVMVVGIAVLAASEQPPSKARRSGPARLARRAMPSPEAP